MNLANRLSAVIQVVSAYRAGPTFTRTSTPFPPRTTVGSLVNPPLSRPCRWLPAVLVALVLVGFAPLKAVAQDPQTSVSQLAINTGRGQHPRPRPRRWRLVSVAVSD